MWCNPGGWRGVLSWRASHEEHSLNFVKMNPAGNTTLLITDAVPRDRHMELSRLLMSPTFLAVEQVGFVEPADDPAAAARLQMMGGEFCGNASRALAALLVERAAPGIMRSPDTVMRPRGQRSWSMKLEVSGCQELLAARVVPMGGSQWWTEITVPVPLRVEVEEGFVRVVMSGIEHLVLEEAEPSPDAYRRLVENGAFSRDVEARGVMFWNPRENRMTPLVVVGDGEPIWESSCGSGSVAVACRVALAGQQAAAGRASVENLCIRQPGGELTVDVDCADGRIRQALLKGTVEKIAQGTVEVPENPTR